jgi:hypothetical protein
MFRPGLVDALERDFDQRYRRALQRSFYPETLNTDEFHPLARAILEGNASTVSPALRRRVLLRAARSAAVRKDLASSERFLGAAAQLDGPDSDLPARALLHEARGEADEAIRILRDLRDADPRSILLGIVARAKGDMTALTWFAEERLSIANLTPGGVNTFAQIHRRRSDLGATKKTLANITDQQFADCPYLYFLRGAVRFAAVLPKPEQAMALGGLALDLRRARPILPELELAAELDAAKADLQRALPLVIELALFHAPRLIRAYLVWCDLLHPRRREAARAQLRNDMLEPAKALPLIQFALAYDPEFDPATIVTYLEKRETLAGLNEDELQARLTIYLHKDDGRGVADVIAKNRTVLESWFGNRAF